MLSVFYPQNFKIYLTFIMWLSGKESACNPGDNRFYPWVRKISWRGKWQPIPVFLPGKSHGRRSLVGYSPFDHKRVGHNLVTKQQQKHLLHFLGTISILVALLLFHFYELHSTRYFKQHTIPSTTPDERMKPGWADSLPFEPQGGLNK